MNLPASIQPVTLPRRLGRAAIEQLLIQILHNLDYFTHDNWELFNSQSYRQDETDLILDKINERLWALEHPQSAALQ